MFSKNNAYYYQELETQLFERQLPFKSLKIPIRDPRSHILQYTKDKYELQQLKDQILYKCKLEELEYLESLRRKRELMEQDVKRRKKMIQIQRLEQNFHGNKRIKERKIRDSLDQLQEKRSKQQNGPKQEIVDSQSQSEMGSKESQRNKLINLKKEESNNKDVDEVMRENIIKKEMSKEQAIKKIKEQMMLKYRFQSEGGKKVVQIKEMKDATEVNWWIKKVMEYKEVEKKKLPKKEQQKLEEEQRKKAEQREAQKKRQNKRELERDIQRNSRYSQQIQTQSDYSYTQSQVSNRKNRKK